MADRKPLIREATLPTDAPANLYGAAFPQWFGTIGASYYTLFQIMTLESWSMDVVRPMMEVYPHSWAFFVPFIACTAFTVLNLFIGVIVSAMQEQHEPAGSAGRGAMHFEANLLLDEIRALRQEVRQLRQQRELERT